MTTTPHLPGTIGSTGSTTDKTTASTTPTSTSTPTTGSTAAPTSTPAAASTAVPASASRRRVLLIGIDGLRLDVLEQTQTPHLDRVLVDGCLTSSLIPAGTPTVSGPMWSSILTGVWAPEHGVMDNEHPPAERAPDVLCRVLDADPGAQVFAAAGWHPLVSAAGCGPVIDPARVTCFATHLGTSGDVQVTDCVTARLEEDDAALRAAFAYLGEIDEVGHRVGVGTEYVEELHRVDTCIGRILDSLERRTDAHEWTVLVTTDHGHVDAGGHGGVSTVERTVWIGASDPQLADKLRDSTDITPLMLELTAAEVPVTELTAAELSAAEVSVTA